MTNQLANEVSPYLLQHAENPVHWRPWGTAAFEEARRRGKPVLLSIGYSACHWCHVMAHESFEHDETAALMNDLFVNIKVDREERPDVDHVYMSALQSLGQQGGWPLTMFLNAEGKPFWGGTYFPRERKYGQPAFRDVLRSVANAFHTKPTDVAGNGEAILAAIGARRNEPAGELSLPLLNQLASRIRDLHDPVHGGLSRAPKFPNPPVLEFLWRAADRTGDESLRKPVLLTLERMCRGGIHDHIGGGFARYSVDEQWLVPHFEKMLYDNAQLLPLLALAAAREPSPLFVNTADHLVAWLRREMLTADGAFSAAQDADSLNPEGHSEEGAFYTFTMDEIRAALGSDAERWCETFDISPGGNFEGRSIPNILARQGLGDESADLKALTTKLFEHRARRPPPGRDDKVLADWNGLMIAGLARAAQLLARADWRDLAANAFESIVQRHGGESILAHAWRDGRRVHPGFASDHAAMGIAALALYEATGRTPYLEHATQWATALLERYRTPDGVIAMTVANAGDLPLRPEPTHDDAVPNANAMAAELYVRLFGLTGEERWLTAADDLFTATNANVRANPFGHAALLNAFDLRLRRADIALADLRDGALSQLAETVPYTNRTLARLSEGALLPKTATTAAGATGAYALVCANGRCSLPVTTGDLLRDRIEDALQI